MRGRSPVGPEYCPLVDRYPCALADISAANQRMKLLDTLPVTQCIVMTLIVRASRRWSPSNCHTQTSVRKRTKQHNPVSTKRG